MQEEIGGGGIRVIRKRERTGGPRVYVRNCVGVSEARGEAWGFASWLQRIGLGPGGDS